MKWLVQEFINDGSNMLRMMKALDHHSIDYLLVRLEADLSLTVINKEDKTPLLYSEKLVADFVRDSHVTIYGSKTFAKIAQRMQLTPGSFVNSWFEFDKVRDVLGTELLNFDFVQGTLSDINPTADRFFIRPAGNTKLFSGMVVTKEEFLEWQQRESGADSPYINQSLMFAPVQDVIAEYRFFVVNQRVITGSSYIFLGVRDTSVKPHDDLNAYVQKIVGMFPLALAFVVDIAETVDGFKVIEYNNINTSGLYGCDEYAIVDEVNRLF